MSKANSQLKELYRQLAELEQKVDPILVQIDRLLDKIAKIEQNPDEFDQDAYLDYKTNEYKDSKLC